MRRLVVGPLLPEVPECPECPKCPSFRDVLDLAEPPRSESIAEECQGGATRNPASSPTGWER